MWLALEAHMCAWSIERPRSGRSITTWLSNLLLFRGGTERCLKHLSIASYLRQEYIYKHRVTYILKETGIYQFAFRKGENTDLRCLHPLMHTALALHYISTDHGNLGWPFLLAWIIGDLFSNAVMLQMIKRLRSWKHGDAMWPDTSLLISFTGWTDHLA